MAIKPNTAKHLAFTRCGELNIHEIGAPAAVFNVIDSEPRVEGVGQEISELLFTARLHDTWHYCSNCAVGPNQSTNQAKKNLNRGEICDPCKSKRSNRNCK